MRSLGAALALPSGVSSVPVFPAALCLSTPQSIILERRVAQWLVRSLSLGVSSGSVPSNCMILTGKLTILNFSSLFFPQFNSVFFFFFLAVSHGTWNLSSLTRDQSHGPCNGGGIPNHSTARGVPGTTFQISEIMALFLEAGLFFSKCDFQTDFFMNAAGLPNTILAKVKMKTWL